MAVKIRLARIGKKNRPYYRIVAIDSRKKRMGESLEVLGAYDPVEGQLTQYNQDRLNDWVSKGAIVTDAVKKLQRLNAKQEVK